MGDLCRQPSKVWWASFPGANESDGDRPWAAALNASSPHVVAHPEDAPADARWDSQREESSSPSGGSHGSQDSGFSDSELHHASPHSSPQDSPDLSKRLQEEASLPSPAQRLKTSPVKKFSYQVVEFKDDCCAGYLETDFSGAPDVSTVLSPRRPLTDDQEKVNKIQNQLELSFKLPKKINSPPTARVASIALSKEIVSPESEGEGYTSESVRSSCSEHTVIELPPKTVQPSPELDQDGFKIPKCLDFRGSCTSLNFAANPPLSCSTPKGIKSEESTDSARSSLHLHRPVLAHETAKSFATVRKLKALSSSKPRRSKRIKEILSKSRCADSKLIGSLADEETPHPVTQWLHDLEAHYEAEIMTTLQSKSLASDLARQVTNMAATTSDTVRKLHIRTRAISTELTKLCQHLKGKKYSFVGPLSQSLTGHIQEFIQEYILSEDSLPIKPAKSQSVNSDKVHDNRCHKEVNEKWSNSTDKKVLKSTNSTLNCEKNTKESPCNCKNTNETKSKDTSEDCKNEKELCQICHSKLDSGKPCDHCLKDCKEESDSLDIKTLSEEVLVACKMLRKLSMEHPMDHSAVDQQRIALSKQFREVVDYLLLTHVKALVSVLEEPRTELALRTALSALCSLGLEGGQLSELVGKCEGVRALLAITLEARAPAVRVGALRALATVCCVTSTVVQFQQAGGVEIVSDVLCDQRRSEEEVREAAAVLAQVTAPWLPDNPPLPDLPQHLQYLVASLTRLMEHYKTSETLLLCCAAVANLTFLEPRTVWYLLENNTAAKLLCAVRKQGPKVSVFIQEQAATVLANMAAIPEVRLHLAQHRAVVALLCFLQIRHSPLQRAPEVAAAERVLQKTAIALSRLCSDATVARQVVELQGVNRLVRLCKDDAERNHSDGVLVACLAALRKIVANCGESVIEDLNAMELIEPRLLDSFLLFSSRQESYV